MKEDTVKEYTVRVYPDGDKVCRMNGKLHREDGPAVEYANGEKAWYLHGEQLSEQKFNERMAPTKE